MTSAYPASFPPGDPATVRSMTALHSTSSSTLGQRSLAVVAPAADTAVSCHNLTKTYGSGQMAVPALRGVTLAFAKSQFSAIMGPSGSGKSTLMHCLAGLDQPTGGQIKLGNRLISGFNDRQLTQLRRTAIGFIFQAFNLVPTLTALENITLPLDLAHSRVDQSWLKQVVDALGIADRLEHRPAELSGGQQQRVACARALATRPEVIFADEPTGNLDSTAAHEVLSLLRRLVDQLGPTVVMVTHDATAAAYADRVVFLADGKVDGELNSPDVDQIVDHLRGQKQSRQQP